MAVNWDRKSGGWRRRGWRRLEVWLNHNSSREGSRLMTSLLSRWCHKTELTPSGRRAARAPSRTDAAPGIEISPMISFARTPRIFWSWSRRGPSNRLQSYVVAAVKGKQGGFYFFFFFSLLFLLFSHEIVLWIRKSFHRWYGLCRAANLAAEHEPRDALDPPHYTCVFTQTAGTFAQVTHEGGGMVGGWRRGGEELMAHSSTVVCGRTQEWVIPERENV